MNYIKDKKDLNGKIVLLRLDLNVPIKNGKITDETRIDKILPIFKYLIEKNSKIIVISHIGRPKGVRNEKLSLDPVCKCLETKLQKKIELIKDNIYNLNKKNLSKKFVNQIIFLENIRFYKEEEDNNNEFSKQLASLGDLFVNDAFSCSHRTHASVCRITKFLPSYAGLQFETEINALKKVTTEIKKPITCIVGGSKISTKIPVIKNLIPKFDNIIIVGAMANNVFKYNGLKIGKSIYEKDLDNLINEIFLYAEKNNCKIYTPIDTKVGKNLNDKSTIKEFYDIEDDDMILDIGPKSLKEILSIIDKSSSLLWNGPLGYFENSNFSTGSFQVAKHIANKGEKIFSVVGGGDTVAVINNLNIQKKFNFVSTAGGAFLEYLEGKVLPGIKALN